MRDESQKTTHQIKKKNMEKIKKLIENFCESFDKKDWILMRNCLSEQLEVDYKSFRGTPKQNISSKEYIEKRIIGLKGLRTEHKTKDYEVIRNEDAINCKCKFEIRRYDENDSENYFHSYGKYEFGFKEKNNTLKIYSIKQTVERMEGEKNIHGAFKK